MPTYNYKVLKIPVIAAPDAMLEALDRHGADGFRVVSTTLYLATPHDQHHRGMEDLVIIMERENRGE